MKTSCIRHPSRVPQLRLYGWQIEACEGDICAAALLSFLEYWHNVKLESQQQAKSANDVAAKHGDARMQDESLYQWHTGEELQQGILGLYGQNVIAKAVKHLERLGFVSIHKNPNPRYKFDRTNFYLLHPSAIQAWIDTHDPPTEKGQDDTTQKDTSESLKIKNRELKSKESTVYFSGMDGHESKEAITVVTSLVTSKEKEEKIIVAEADASAAPTAAEKLVTWWNVQIVPMGARPFSLDDADAKFITKANNALKAKSSRGFWDRVKQGFEQSLFLQGSITPPAGKRRFKASLPWLLSQHHTKGMANYSLVAEGEWADDTERPSRLELQL